MIPRKTGLVLLLACLALGAGAANTRRVKRPAKAKRVPKIIDPNASKLAPQSQEVIPGRQFPEAVRQAPATEETPRVIRWMIKPVRRGMFVRLPIIDTDPNRGITVGVMPIWVLQGETDDRITQIHAPSLTRNNDFKIIPTYRYYYYPQEDASLMVRGSFSKYEREAFVEYEDGSIAGSDLDVFLRLQYNVDAGQRFFGFGPDSSKNGEANYKEEYAKYKVGIGVPFSQGSPWRAHFSQRYQAGRILDGPLKNLPVFSGVYPNETARSYQQTTENRFSLDYDTRDHGVTTSRGILAQAAAEYAIRGLASQFDYSRYGLEARWFHPWESDKDKVVAIQAKYEQLLGPTPPFWLQSRLGGKYSLRAYGDGRYIDRGMAAVNVEQRFKLLEQKTAGVTTELQLAPFIGLGEVFDNPNRAAARYARPVFGAAIRAVAKPQVVGSVDFGVGQEGLAVFMDINYSF